MISAIVLAAGQATRFGECKQVLLLDRVLDNLRASKVDDIVVVLGAHADEIRRKVRIEERTVLNPDYASGMSSSIRAGLRGLAEETEAALIVLGDQPFVAPRTIDLIVDAYRATRPRAVIPVHDGQRGNPVLVDRALFGEMLHLRGDVGFRAVFEAHGESIVRLPVDDGGVLVDIDTKEDLRHVPRREAEAEPDR